MAKKRSGPDEREFGERLASIRQRIGRSQEEMAKEFDLSLSGYQNYEYGKRGVPGWMLGQLLLHFMVNPVWMLTGDGPAFLRNHRDLGLVNPEFMQKILSALVREAGCNQNLIRRISLFTVTAVYNRVVGETPPGKSVSEAIDNEVRYVMRVMRESDPNADSVLKTHAETQAGLNHEKGPQSDRES